MTETYYDSTAITEVLTSEQIDNSTIEVNTLIREKVETRTYDYYFLVRQLEAIQADLASYTVARNAEIAEIEALLALFTEIPPAIVTDNPYSLT